MDWKGEELLTQPGTTPQKERCKTDPCFMLVRQEELNWHYAIEYTHLRPQVWHRGT